MERVFDVIRAIGFRRGPRRLAGGICGGISEKFGISLGLVRLLMLVSFLMPFIGIGAYLVAWILLPWQDSSIPLERLISSRRRS